MSENENPIQKAVLLSEGNNHLPSNRLKLLQEHDIFLREVSETCNSYGIKVIGCQFGSFK
jgi:hypothetical protein